MSDAVTIVPNAGWDARIIVCRCGPLVDVFLIISQTYVVLVDTLINPETSAALLAIAQPYLEKRTLLVINTHADWDHAWGNDRFTGPNASHPAPIIATRHCAERLQSANAAEKLAAMRAQQPGRFDQTTLVAPTILFDNDLTVNCGDLTLELFCTPGHQPDHLSIWIPEIKTVLAGDAAEAPFPFTQSAKTLPQVRASIKRMADLDPAYTLYCHAPETASTPLLHANLHYFQTLEDHCRQALASGIDPFPAEDVDLETLIGLPFEQALPMPTSQPDFYRPGHRAHIRMMLEWCAEN